MKTTVQEPVMQDTDILGTDLFGDRRSGQKMGSYSCPTCGRFAKIVRVGNDSNPEYYYESYYIVVDCKKCGIGETS